MTGLCHHAVTEHSKHKQRDAPTKILVVLNYLSFGTGRSYNGLRLVGAISKRVDVEVRVVLFGDNVGCTLGNHKLPDGVNHPDRMRTTVVRRGGSAAAGRAWTPGGSPTSCSSTAPVI